MPRTREERSRHERMSGEWEALLTEARDLLRHDGRHVQQSDGTFPWCAGCDLEHRIDEALADD
jgi:hypothetical protein